MLPNLKDDLGGVMALLTTEVINDNRWLMFHDTCLIGWPSLFNDYGMDR